MASQQRIDPLELVYLAWTVTSEITGIIIDGLSGFYNFLEPRVLLPIYHKAGPYIFWQKAGPQKPYTGKSYRINYANRFGGAKILMKSTDELRSTSNILEEKRDTYMFTESPLPFSMIIALTEEVSVEEVFVTTTQMYSRSVK